MITIDKISTLYHLRTETQLLMNFVHSDPINTTLMCDMLTCAGAVGININRHAGIIAFSLYCSPDALPTLDARVETIRDQVADLLLDRKYKHEEHGERTND